MRVSLVCERFCGSRSGLRSIASDRRTARTATLRRDAVMVREEALHEVAARRD